MDKLDYALILISIILVAIVAAFIFSSRFRKDVIAAEGEANILGVMSVRGVVIVLMMAIFVGVLIYILNLEFQSKKFDLNTESAIILLQSTDDDTYSLGDNKDDPGLQDIIANGKIIGQINKEQNGNLIVQKSLMDINKWNIELLSAPLGSISVNGQGGYIQWNERDSVRRDAYRINESYKLKNIDLWFRIDSIIVEHIVGTRYQYYLSFGEGEIASSIEWRKTSERFTKTPDGKIYINDEFRPIRNLGWENDYYIKFAAGQPGTAESKLNYVEKLNIIAVGIRVE